MGCIERGGVIANVTCASETCLTILPEDWVCGQGRGRVWVPCNTAVDWHPMLRCFCHLRYYAERLRCVACQYLRNCHRKPHSLVPLDHTPLTPWQPLYFTFVHARCILKVSERSTDDKNEACSGGMPGTKSVEERGATHVTGGLLSCGMCELSFELILDS